MFCDVLKLQHKSLPLLSVVRGPDGFFVLEIGEGALFDWQVSKGY